MDKFKIALDKFYTTDYITDFELWVDVVYHHFTCQLPVSFEESDVENLWLGKLYDLNKDPAEAAKIIERAYIRYEKKLLT
jgi:hypothetical protein